MRILLTRNPSSGRRAYDESFEEVREILQSLGELETFEASSLAALPHEMAAAAARRDLVVVCGGDGSLNRCLNALSDRLDDLVFSVIPMGTGNDLARTLGIGTDPAAAARGLLEGEERAVDVGRARGPGTDRIFVNACIGGFSVMVDEEVDDDAKKRFGPLAFWIGGIKALAKLDRWSVTVNGSEVTDCVAVGVGNGRTCGGGIEVWPSALPDDGVLDACALPAATIAGAMTLAAKIATGTHEAGDAVTARGPRVEIDADPRLELNVDGELIGLFTPATFEIAGRARFWTPRLPPSPPRLRNTGGAQRPR